MSGKECWESKECWQIFTATPILYSIVIFTVTTIMPLIETDMMNCDKKLKEDDLEENWEDVKS